MDIPLQTSQTNSVCVIVMLIILFRAGILQECGDLIYDQQENILLGEQQFGLFEGVPLDELAEQYPREMEHFEKCIKFGGRFWARPRK
jgi:broad specificity phosphatase PhoE